MPAKLPPAEFASVAARLRAGLAERIVGMDEVIDEVLLCVAGGGHGLLVGVPGLAKTLLVSTLAELLGLGFKRIQFTPDLMPSDIVGAEILGVDENGRRAFRFQRGPVFTNLLLADEINRTPPKTQAALMEAMEEGTITSQGRRHALTPPFLVLATQNPIEQEGTYPLPAAQLDRFLVKIRVDYPEAADEKRMVRRTTSRRFTPLDPVLDADGVLALAATVRATRAPESVMQYAVDLVRASRPEDVAVEVDGIDEAVSFGAGPRAAAALVTAATTRALLEGRNEATAADVRSVAHPVLRHRLVLSFRASAEGLDAEALVDRLLAGVPAPDRVLATG